MLDEVTVCEAMSSQVGGHFTSKNLYATGIAQLTQNVVVEWITATIVRVR